MRFDIAARAILGKRSSQQDSWRVIDERGTDLGTKPESGFVSVADRSLVIVADGVGGYAGGEEASRLACDKFAEAFAQGQGTVEARLRQALDVANAAIAAAQRQNPDKKDMSTTFIGIYLEGGKMKFVSVGDSLLLRYRDEEIHRVNLDHSYADVLDRRLLHLGSDKPNEWAVAINDDQRAAITLALSGGPLDRAEYGHWPQVAARDLLPGDVLIAASDGIETIEMVQLQSFVRQLEQKGADAGGIADGLIKAAEGIGPNRRREPDNTTIVVVKVPDGGKAAAAASGAAAQHTVIGRVGTAVKRSPAVMIGALVAVVALIGIALLLVGSRLPPRDPGSVASPGTTTQKPGSTKTTPGQGPGTQDPVEDGPTPTPTTTTPGDRPGPTGRPGQGDRPDLQNQPGPVPPPQQKKSGPPPRSDNPPPRNDKGGSKGGSDGRGLLPCGEVAC